MVKFATYLFFIQNLIFPNNNESTKLSSLLSYSIVICVQSCEMHPVPGGGAADGSSQGACHHQQRTFRVVVSALGSPLVEEGFALKVPVELLSEFHPDIADEFLLEVVHIGCFL